MTAGVMNFVQISRSVNDFLSDVGIQLSQSGQRELAVARSGPGVGAGRPKHTHLHVGEQDGHGAMRSKEGPVEFAVVELVKLLETAKRRLY